jgi:thiamine kinase-like enzyme
MEGGSTSVDPRLEAVIRAIPEWRDAGTVTTLPLEGGITNQNYLVTVDEERYVVRLAGKDTELLGIDREAERAAAEAAHAVGIGPEVVRFIPDLGCLVTRFIEAIPVPPERMREPQMLARVTGALRAFHGGHSIPSAFSPFRVVETYRDEAAARDVAIPTAYARLREAARGIESAFHRAPLSPRPCHNDLLNANFLLQDDRIFIVDYEYAGMGHLFFDLGNFSVNHDFGEEEDARLVASYFGQRTTEAVARLKLMKIMSDFREAMWGVVQQAISTLDFDYVAYAAKHFERCLRATSDPSYEEWLEVAQGPAPVSP